MESGSLQAIRQPDSIQCGRQLQGRMRSLRDADQEQPYRNGVDDLDLYFHDLAVSLVYPESAFDRAKYLCGAGSGLVSRPRHSLDDEAAVAIQPTFSGQTKLASIRQFIPRLTRS